MAATGCGGGALLLVLVLDTSSDIVGSKGGVGGGSIVFGVMEGEDILVVEDDNNIISAGLLSCMYLYVNGNSIDVDDVIDDVMEVDNGPRSIAVTMLPVDTTPLPAGCNYIYIRKNIYTYIHIYDSNIHTYTNLYLNKFIYHI